MMKKADYPNTLAVRFLTARQIDFRPHLYCYENHGGTRHAAESLGVSEHAVVKTLVMETQTHQPLFVLMHGDCEVSTKQLARVLGEKQVKPCAPETAQKHTGYQVGGISPFGTRKVLPVYVETSILELDSIYINGGKRGFLVEIDPEVLLHVFPATTVDIAREDI
jgi:Cys-tRNA(Pro) deacylase